MTRFSCLALLAALLPACSAEAPEGGDGRAAEPIIYGTPDTQNLATVWVDAPTTFCTGTIIGKNGSTGYVLTAAHCTADLVIETADYDDCSTPGACIVHNVTGTVTHPSWIKKASSLEFQVLTIDGVDANTPVVPIAHDPDGLALGTMIELSGYGYSNGPNGVLDNLHQRQHTTTTIHTLTPNGLPEGVAFLFKQSFDGPQGGGCNGDSGGPVYEGTGPNRRVVGVITSGNTGCDQYGIAARVSSQATQFIEAVINGSPLPPAADTCDTCRIETLAGTCSKIALDCGYTFDCDDAETCWTLCPDDACRASCLKDLPGSAMFLQEMQCLCGECAALCGSCALVPPAGAGGAGGGGTGGGESGGAGPGGGGPGGGSAGGSGGAGGGEPTDPPKDEGGCGCRVEGSNGGEGASALALFAALAAFVRRRRRSPG